MSVVNNFVADIHRCSADPNGAVDDFDGTDQTGAKPSGARWFDLQRIPFHLMPDSGFSSVPNEYSQPFRVCGQDLQLRRTAGSRPTASADCVPHGPSIANRRGTAAGVSQDHYSAPQRHIADCRQSIAASLLGGSALADDRRRNRRDVIQRFALGSGSSGRAGALRSSR